MKIPALFRSRNIRPASIIVLASFTLVGAAWAQLGSAGSSSTGSTATQLPLSGRSGQSGTVAASETPVPGTTTSINTLNPGIQVQGPFSGSVTGAPFSGKLSLQDAIQRGLRYNLGTVGLSQAAQQAHGQNRVARSALMPNLNGS
ncbi:MAG TPA: hypothetical protein VI685_20445, partial [Candidatus Angelobacter sp.]